MSRRKSAFTLIELLVVISIIALLISILLPSLTAARRQSRDVACRAHLSMLAKTNFTYLTDNNEWLPGVNTTGLPIRKAVWKGGLTEEALRKRASWPVQTYDWITPSLGTEFELSGSNRADRLALITEKYNCPEQRTVESYAGWPFQNPSDPSSGPNTSEIKDGADFKDREWTALSYLQSAHFQYWGGRYKNQVLWKTGSTGLISVTATGAPDDWEVEAPDYRSRIGDLGTPSRKVFAADGTRYVTDEGYVNFDVTPNPNYFGSFTSSGAWWRGSNTYGPKEDTPGWGRDGLVNVSSSGRGSISRGKNLRYSYRHGGNNENDARSAAQNKGRINAAFFDGSVQSLSDFESRKPELWYPKGSKVRTPGEGMTLVEQDYIIR